MMRLAELLAETRLLLQVLKPWLEALHAAAPITTASRSVLALILRTGPLSVPVMARLHGVTRQNVQVQIDALLDADLVVRQPNPAHKRSPLIALTDRGRGLIREMRAEELRALSRLQTGVSDEALADATQVLAAVRAALVSDTS